MPRVDQHRPRVLHHLRAWQASRALGLACVAWGYGEGPVEPYLEAYAAWRLTRSMPWGELLGLERTARNWMIGDAPWVAAHGVNVTSILRPDLRQQRVERARRRSKLFQLFRRAA